MVKKSTKRLSEILKEGEEIILQELINWCRKGPELAVVKNVEIEEGEIRDFKSFDILR